MTKQPLVDLRGLVRCQVVEHDFDVEVLWHRHVDLVQKGEEVLCGVALLNLGDHVLISVITVPVAMFNAGKTVTGATSLIVVRRPSRGRQRHREGRSRPVERPDLGLFVDGEDHRGDHAFWQGPSSTSAWRVSARTRRSRQRPHRRDRSEMDRTAPCTRRVDKRVETFEAMAPLADGHRFTPRMGATSRSVSPRHSRGRS
jgi:hypothetical protein